MDGKHLTEDLFESLESDFSGKHLPISENFPDITYTLDNEGKITSISNSVEFYGFSQQELIGTDIMEIVHPHDRTKARFRINERRTGQRSTTRLAVSMFTSCGNMKELNTPNDKPSIFLVSATGIYGKNQKDFIGTQGTARNIGELEQLKRELDAKEMHLKLQQARLEFIYEISEILTRHDLELEEVFNCVLDGIVRASGDHESASARIVLSGREIRSHLFKVTSTKISSEFLIDKNVSGLFQLFLGSPPPSTKLLQEHTQLVDTVARQLEKTIKLKKNIKKLKNSEKKARTVFEQAADSIVLSEPDTGKIIEFNTCAHETLGYSKEEFKNLSISDITAPEKTGSPDPDLPQNGSAIYKTRHITKSGETLFIQATQREIAINGKKYTLNIFHDTSHLKQLENKHIKESKIESVGTFAGGIAHDFNNLLMVILGNIELTEMEGTENSRLKTAIDTCDDAKNLACKIVTISKTGNPITREGSLDELIKDSAIPLPGSSIGCVIAIADDLWKVRFDESQIKIAMSNLINNAMEAMPTGGTININANNCVFTKTSPGGVPPGEYVKIEIHDEGMGIPRKHRYRIFDPYFSTKEKGTQKGLGLGLSIVFSIIHKHKGHITTDSDTSGTTFSIYLPRSTNVKKDHPHTEPLFPEKKRILIMDDEDMVRDIACQILIHLGYQAYSAKTGEDTIRMYSNALNEGCPFDAVILDLTIKGGMDGRETMEHLLSIDPSIKAIVSSGHTRDPAMIDFRKFGFCGITAKPYKIKELQQVISQTLGTELRR